MIFRQNLDVSNIVRDSFYLKLCHFWKLTEFLVLPSSRFHANTRVCSYGEMNIYLLDPVQNFWLYFLSTTYLKHLTFLEPRSFFGAANIMHWKSIMDTVFDTIFRRAKDWFETLNSEGSQFLWRVEKRGITVTLYVWWDSPIWIFQLIFMWICMYVLLLLHFAKTKRT